MTSPPTNVGSSYIAGPTQPAGTVLTQTGPQVIPKPNKNRVQV